MTDFIILIAVLILAIIAVGIGLYTIIKYANDESFPDDEDDE